MQTDGWTTYLLIIAVLGLIAAGWWLVRSRRAGPGGTAGPDRMLEPGWQFYGKPTALEPPGTVFRIDPHKRRYLVDTLDLPVQAGDEAFGRHRERVAASMGMVARFFGLEGASVKVEGENTQELEFEMVGARREVVEDADLDPALTALLERLQYRADNRYFIIRECRTATGVTYHLEGHQVDRLGGEAALKGAVGVEGRLYEGDRSREYVLEQTFDAPLRVLFMPEEIRPLARGLAGEKPRLGTAPVREVLEWEEGEKGAE